ncbi:MAG: CHAT domain-containing protein [Silicimonas sp.]|nr:CHAT domain-containing protein [Silicimonas sp.]
MPTLERLLRLAVLILCLLAPAGAAEAQTREERALVAAFQARDLEALRRVARVIERGLDEGRPVTRSDRTESFGTIAFILFSLGDPETSLHFFERATEAAFLDGRWFEQIGFELRYEMASVMMLLDRQDEAIVVLSEAARDLERFDALISEIGLKTQQALLGAHMMREDWPALEALARHLLQIGEAAQPENVDAIKMASTFLAHALRFQNRAEEAIPVARRGLEAVLSVHAPDSVPALETRSQLAMAIEESARFSEARALYEGILEDIGSGAVDPDHPVVETVQVNAKSRLAKIAKMEGQYFQFRDLNRDVMEALAANGTPERRLEALEALAKTAMGNADIELAGTLYGEVIALVDAHPELPVEAGARARVQRARTLLSRSLDFAELKALLDPAVEVLQAQLGSNHLDTLRARALIIHARRGEAQAFEVLARLGQSPVFSGGGPEATVLTDADFDILRRLAEAETAAQGPMHGFTHFINLANTLTEFGRFEEALAVLASLDDFDLVVQAGGTRFDVPLEHMLHEARANVFHNMGDFDQAVRILERGVRDVIDMMREMRWAGSIGGAGDFHAFSRLYGWRQSASIWFAAQGKPLADRAEYLAKAFEALQLASYGPAAASVSRGTLRRATEDPGLQEVIAEFEALSGFRSEPRAGSSAELLESAEQRRARAARITLLHTEIENRFPTYFDAQVAEPIPLAEITSPDRAETMLNPDEALILIQPMGVLPGARHGINGLVLAVTREGTAWAEVPISLEQLVLDVGILHHALDPDGRAPTVLAGLRAPMSAVTGEEAAAPAGAKRHFAFENAARLHDALFGAPEVAALIGDKPQWTIVPSGAAMTIPFAALVTHDPGSGRFRAPEDLRAVSWLGHERALSIVPSVVALKDLRARDPARATATTLAYLGIGDPLFQGAEDEDLPTADDILALRGTDRALGIRALPRLPGTRREVAALAQVFDTDPDAIALGARATEGFVRAMNDSGRLSEARIVHFATHGLLSGAFQGLGEPALALTPPAAGQGIGDEDGLLTASEAARLDLNAEWVILSACDTAGREGVFGDGLGGLAQGFFNAGAQSLLVSQWRVDDVAAERLTTGTVVSAEGGTAKAEALRQTMRALAADRSRDDGPISNAHPSIWAPFLLVGGG